MAQTGKSCKAAPSPKQVGPSVLRAGTLDVKKQGKIEIENPYQRLPRLVKNFMSIILINSINTHASVTGCRTQSMRWKKMDVGCV